MQEKTLQNYFIRWLRKTHPNVFYYKTNDRFVAGLPDVVLCVNGRFLGIEFKSSRGRLTRLQALISVNIMGSGGEYLVTSSFDEACSKVESLLKLNFNINRTSHESAKIS